MFLVENVYSKCLLHISVEYEKVKVTMKKIK